MTTEREQLKMAAKACGLHFNPTLKLKQGLHIVKPDAKCQSDQVLWDPKNDDGDCARMEAALGIDVKWYKSGVIAHIRDTGIQSEVFINHASDKNAARRAASVAIAVEIWRLM